VRIENWSVGHFYRDNGYRPPESNPTVIRGAVYGHPRHPDGRHVKTSAIVEAVGRTVTTENGSTYQLGEPDPKYVEWWEVQGKVWNPEQPIIMKERGT
jgi:hypothetical protein